MRYFQIDLLIIVVFSAIISFSSEYINMPQPNWMHAFGVMLMAIAFFGFIAGIHRWAEGQVDKH